MSFLFVYIENNLSSLILSSAENILEQYEAQYKNNFTLFCTAKKAKADSCMETEINLALECSSEAQASKG